MIYRNPPSQLKLTVHRHRDRARQRWFACNPVSNLSIDTQREKKKKKLGTYQKAAPIWLPYKAIPI